MDEELHRLVKEAKQGSEEAFTELVSRYKGQVFRHAFAMVQDRMEAEDIAQEAFVKSYLSLPKLTNEFAFVSWLTRIVANLCYDRLKKIQKEKNISTNQDEQSVAMVDQSQTRMEIQEALKTLSAEQRNAIILRDMQGYGYDEIAKILQIPLGTVKSRINAARAALRKEFVRSGEDE